MTKLTLVGNSALGLVYLMHSCLVLSLVDSDADQYTQLINTEMRVRIRPLRVLAPNTSLSAQLAHNCSMVLRRDSCSGPIISRRHKISWNTQICFQWRCALPDYGIRVENCSTGSLVNPVYLLANDGCTAETSMLTTPVYSLRSLSEASSIGWLTVRLVGASFIRLGCDIRLCHLCDCASILPPRNCTDYGAAHDNDRLKDFNATMEYPDLCDVTELDTSDLTDDMANSTPSGLTTAKKTYLFVTIGVVALLTALISGCAVLADHHRYSPVTE